jgi:hypothetical protein
MWTSRVGRLSGLCTPVDSFFFFFRSPSDPSLPLARFPREDSEDFGVDSCDREDPTVPG